MGELLRKLSDLEEATFGRLFSTKTVKVIGATVVGLEVMHRFDEILGKHRDQKEARELGQQNEVPTQEHEHASERVDG
jgi:hypothetical protein